MLLISLLITPILGIFLISTSMNEDNSKSTYKRVRITGLITSTINFFLSLIVFLLFNLSTNQFQFVQEHYSVKSFDFYLGVDGISIYFVLLTTIIMPISMLSNWKSIANNVRSYVIIMLVLETLLLAVFLVLDILLFYIFFESILPPLFLLIGLFGSKNKVRASFYLFLYTLLGSLFLLLSILAMSSIMGTTDFDALYKTNFNYYTQLFLFSGIFIAFAVKTPTIFLNNWLLKAHVESPLGGSIVLAGIVLKLSLYGVLRLILPLLPKALYFFTPFVYVVGVITIVYASFSTLRTVDVKELIAYSSVSHAAVYLLGVFSNTIQGIEGGIILGLGHGFVSSGLFVCAGGVLYDRSSTRLITYYRGITQIMPIFSILFFILCLGNAGTPLTLNFVGEFMSLYGVFERLPLLGALASSSIVFSAAYTIYMFNRIAFGGSFSRFFTRNVPDVNKREFVILLILVLFTVCLGIYPSPILDGLHYSVSSLPYNSLLILPFVVQAKKVNKVGSWSTIKYIKLSLLITAFCVLLLRTFLCFPDFSPWGGDNVSSIENVFYLVTSICYFAKYYLFNSITYSFVFTLVFTLFYLEGWKLSNNPHMKWVQIILLLLCLVNVVVIYYDMIDYLCRREITYVNENANTSNNLSLGANVELSKQWSKEIGTEISNLGTNIVLGATAAGIAGAVGKTIAKSGMPPIQRAAVVLGSGAAGAGIYVAASAVNRKNNANYNRTYYGHGGNDPHRFMDDDTLNSSLFDLTLGLKWISYGCFLLVLILLIQIVFKFYLEEDKVRLNLSRYIGQDINNKLNYYLVKIVKLNKKMSHFFIWFILVMLAFGLFFSTYFSAELHHSLNVYVEMHINKN